MMVLHSYSYLSVVIDTFY